MVNEDTISAAVVGLSFIAKPRFSSFTVTGFPDFFGVGDYVCASYCSSSGDMSPIMTSEPSPPVCDDVPTLNESRTFVIIILF